MNERPWLNNYDEGVPESLDYPEEPLYYFLDKAAQEYPDLPCTIFKGAKISYAEMKRLTDSLAAGLVSLGVEKGDRIGIFMLNTPQFVIAYFAILKAGGVVVATNPLYSSQEIEHQAKDAGIKIMIVMSNFYDRIKEVQAATGIEKVVVTNLKEYLPPVLSILFTLTRERKGGFRIDLAAGDVWLKDLLTQYEGQNRPPVDVTANDFALFQYSGGTTGVPKAAIALHRNLIANTLQIANWFGPTTPGEETLLMAIPLFHVYGMVAGMNFAIAKVASIVMVPDPRDLKDVLGNIQKYEATLFPGVPAIYNGINNFPEVIAGNYDLSSIKACISGSAPLLLETKNKFEELTGGKLFEGYGLSEAPTATHCNPLSGENKSGSIGMPLSDVDCRIISLEDDMTVLGPNEVGELIVRGPQVMHGYHNMPTETHNTLRDGWLHTGDIARMDGDGYFYIVDRKKELIKPGGFQVWPREVEEAIALNPKVLDVGVAGIPDPYRGETVKAWVVVKPGKSLTEDDVKDWCRERLAKYKVPTHVEFRKELPKTTVGKILRRELVRQHADTGAPE